MRKGPTREVRHLLQSHTLMSMTSLCTAQEIPSPLLELSTPVDVMSKVSINSYNIRPGGFPEPFFLVAVLTNSMALLHESKV